MNKIQRDFVRTVYDYYRIYGRHGLPWRQTSDPYAILVSEVMLQQTQVERVVPKYQAFLRQYPTPQALTTAALKDVLLIWQGLGYNRRAQALWRAAQYVTNERAAHFPTTYDELLALPGVGPYTAGAIMAFAYNQPVPLIETNIRTAYLFHFFPKQRNVTDAAILEQVTATLDTAAPRQWYAALMDYGTYIKREYGNQNRRTTQYRPQSTFRGSNREVRGAIIRYLAIAATPCTLTALKTALKQFPAAKIEEQLAVLSTEELVVQIGRRFTIPT